ncbi:hypothetical protein [Desulfonatronum thiosulfatophilum]|uniref:hypothetical protein n=1 Tax=Desulfonatronum thiosulfatophilum TaxID=617002 RepID=UPI0011139797|nr:hypothetical protein [Desulfonatronum thiosulfatophilum]
MQKIMVNILAAVIILSVFVASATASTGLEAAYNRCLENCVELDKAVCEQCCEKAFEPVVINCRMKFINCLKYCKNDKRCENNCYYKVQSCGTGAKGEHVCP